MNPSKNANVTMSKLYVGNLPMDSGESALRQLFSDHNLTCSEVLVKRGGYAFVDCPDQSSADRAIDKLNGMYINMLYLISFHGQMYIKHGRRLIKHEACHNTTLV